MKDYEDNWEQLINDLLDGELSELEAEQLKAEAKDNAKLASMIVDAYQLQQLMSGLPPDRAPASLTERLLAIPAEQQAAESLIPQGGRPGGRSAGRPKARRWWFEPRWVTALAAVPLAIIAVNMWQPNLEQPGIQQPGLAQPGNLQTEPPSMAEIEQARQDLAIAFAYLDKAGRITSQEIENQVGDTMTDAIAGSVFKNVTSQYEISKEKNT